MKWHSGRQFAPRWFAAKWWRGTTPATAPQTGVTGVLQLPHRRDVKRRRREEDVLIALLR